jgi:predicted hotdog family 3-hydroxylacyl-ACP dehydratase
VYPRWHGIERPVSRHILGGAPDGFGMNSDPRNSIPHRPPILCIDRVLEADADHAMAERVVAPGADIEEGELWEEGLVEGLAQTAAVLNAFDERKAGRRSRKGMLVGVRRCQIRRRARVGERLTFRVELIRRILPLAVMRCEVRAGDELLASGEMKFYVEVEE